MLSSTIDFRYALLWLAGSTQHWLIHVSQHRPTRAKKFPNFDDPELDKSISISRCLPHSFRLYIELVITLLRYIIFCVRSHARLDFVSSAHHNVNLSERLKNFLALFTGDYAAGGFSGINLSDVSKYLSQHTID